MLEKIKRFIFDKYLNEKDLKEIRELHRLESGERYKFQQVKNNTALVKGSRKWLNTQKGIIDVLAKSREHVVSQKLINAGVPEGQPSSLDLKTGKITIHEHK